MSILGSILKTQNERTLKKFVPTIRAINNLEPTLSSYSDDDLKAASNALRGRIKAQKIISNDMIVEGFAIVREASNRVLQMPHFDVQLVGGLVLHLGKIAEMRTGEGKTLVATLPAYLNSAIDQVHVVTVNDYLAKRDCEIIKPIFDFLGVSSSFLQDTFSQGQRKEAYEAEIVYGTSSQFGFDYIRDNMVLHASEKLQKSHHFAIIDEADSILIDEARTPLIISGAGDEDPNRYIRIMNLTSQFSVLIKGDDKPTPESSAAEAQADAILLEKSHSSRLTDRGFNKLEKMMTEFNVIINPGDLYTHQFLSIVTDFQQALKAKHLYSRDTDYIVRDNKVEIIDENTGRISEGRRWSDGLHQFIEAKEGVSIKSETVSLGSITLQNFYKLYDRISGMTGTADTEASEFLNVYGLDVVVIPTNKPINRHDALDVLYMSNEGKVNAIIDDIQTRHKKGQPVLVGTSSVENSEIISSRLSAVGIPHNVLNAKQHEKEALTIAQAGRSGAVTIATNMAGRGTDIILGGNYKLMAQNLIDPNDEASIQAIKQACEEDYASVIKAGGLHVIGTERHDSRRIDNQLRGRAGRQGDVGSSIFYVSFEDRVMRISGEKLHRILTSFGLKKEDSISNSMVRKGIQKAQIAIESHNFEQRKELVKFDEVITKQRKEIYSYRNTILDADNNQLIEISNSIIKSALNETLKRFLPDGTFSEQWNYQGLQHFVKNTLFLDIPVPSNPEESESFDSTYFINSIENAYDLIFTGHLQFMEANGQSTIEMRRSLLLQSIDSAWRDNISDMETLQEGIHLRGYSNKDPKQEFSRESINRFSDMINEITETYMISIFRAAQDVCGMIIEQQSNAA
jgi:preprotein translocase subunit SecA